MGIVTSLIPTWVNGNNKYKKVENVDKLQY